MSGYMPAVKWRTLHDLIQSGPDEKVALTIPFGPDEAPHSKAFHCTYQKLRKSIQTVQAALANAGVSRGDTVALYYPNTLPYVIGFFAVATMGATAAPLNPKYREQELRFYLGDSSPVILLMPANLGDPLIKECARTAQSMGITVWFLDFDLVEGNLELLAYPTGRAPVEVGVPEPMDVAMILHTSGTTSRPKMVPLRHGNLTQSVGNIVRTYKLSPEDKVQLVMPLFHVHGMIGCLLSTLESGGSIVLPAKFSARRFWKTFLNFDCTWYSAVPTIHAILLRTVDDHYHTLTPAEMTRLHKSWRFTRSCSASLPAATLKKLETLFKKPWLEAYAMTEASHQMTANPLPENGPHKAGSVGRPTNVTVILLDDNDEELTEIGAVGEVSIRAPNVMHRYLVPKAANAKAFSWVNSRGAYFFRTGDQARFDEDGFLFLTGRLKEMINRGGEKIAPLEIDNILTQHPNVNTAVAFGVPDEIYGETVNAAVILKDPNTSTSEAELITFCKERLSGFKVPAKMFITDDVPRTATGKIQRRIVSAHFQKLNKAKL